MNKLFSIALLVSLMTGCAAPRFHQETTITHEKWCTGDRTTYVNDEVGSRSPQYLVVNPDGSYGSYGNGFLPGVRSQFGNGDNFITTQPAGKNGSRYFNY